MIRVLLALVASVAPAFAQAPTPAPLSAADAARRVLEHPKLFDAMVAIERDHDKLIGETIALTEIPAPPFKESARAAAVLALLRQTGLTNVEQDAAGNVMGLRRGTGGGTLVAVAAHLDTVFPEGVDVRVRREGTRLEAPGIGDNSRSLAVLLAIARALETANVSTKGDILFVANVGEEGPGDLRGVRYLFADGAYKDRIKTFIALDGAGSGDTITHGAVGSRRYRVTFRGPGGHSYGAFGLVNPAYAMGHALEKLSKTTVPTSPRTTFNVGVISGGTSVNSIPGDVWMDVDIRSESPAELERVEQSFRMLMTQAADEENQTRSTALGKIAVTLEVIGDRPAGQTPLTSPLVEAAAAIARGTAVEPRFVMGSTDSNIPISLGIPAVTLSSGARGDRAHALDEWIDVDKEDSLAGIRRAVALILTMAGL